MLLTTRLTGVVTTEDVQRWKESLERDAAAIPDGGTFKLLLDLCGYEPADIEAHKAMRAVIPLGQPARRSAGAGSHPRRRAGAMVAPSAAVPPLIPGRFAPPC